MKKQDKTNVVRILEQKKLPHKCYLYGDGEAISGVEVARILEQDVECVFKTLVTQGASKNYYVFMIPVALELDLKKAAKAVGEKSVAMIKSKELLPLTGYVHGGCSPIGMKKQFRTTVHFTARDFETIFFSAGRIGAQIEMSPLDLEKVVRLEYADVTISE
jgi:Cys-tRNA(Pro)/Cys-tRNA(Cys) deacylase